MSSFLFKMTDNLFVHKLYMGTGRCIERLSSVYRADSQPGDTHVKELSESEIFVQDVRLPQARISSALRAVSVQIERLSPLPAANIHWSLSQSPAENKASKNTNRVTYTLGIVRKDTLLTLQDNGSHYVWLKSPGGGTFKFECAEGIKVLGRKTLGYCMYFALIYALLLWVMVSWSNRFDADRLSYLKQSAEMAESIKAQQENEVRLRRARDTLRIRLNGTQNDMILKSLIHVSQSLSSSDEVLQISAEKAAVLITVNTSSSDALIAALHRAAPTSTVSLSQISAAGFNEQSRAIVKIENPAKMPEANDVTP